jgi:hypothetical protein
MRPLSLITGGLALVALDFRTESLDLLPDPVGWVLVAAGSWGLSLASVSWLAGITAALTVSDAALPYRYVRVDPLAGDRVALSERANVDLSLHLEFDPVSGWRLAAMTLAMSTAGVTLWSLLRGLERRAHAHAQSGTAGCLRVGRWLVAVVWVLPYLVAVGRAVVVDSGRFDPIWNGSAEYVALAGVAVIAYVVVVLARDSGAAWAQPGDHPLTRAERSGCGRAPPPGAGPVGRLTWHARSSRV